MSTMPPTASHTREEIDALLAAQQDFAPRVRAHTARQRIAKLDAIAAYLDRSDNLDRLLEALRKDFGKHEVESLTSEVGVLLGQIRYVRARLARWMEPRKLPGSLTTLGIRSYVYHEPKGNALIIAPWNYPFYLALAPLVYALAAGCTAIVKPSEMSGHTAAYITAMLGELFDEREVATVTGGADTAAYLTSCPFHHIFFTGSPAVGKKVMAAAAGQLASVTLELGGKSPAVVDDSVTTSKSAANTAWGKFFNAGQTCIAPDYLLVPEHLAAEYVAALGGAITKFYGAEPRESESLARIITDRHYDRLEGLLEDALAKGATLAHGGQRDAATRYVAPTVLTDVTEEMDVMREEIFGPLLPVMTYRSLDEAVAIINRRPKPLAFYVQSHRRETIRTLLRGTSSGGAVVNEYLIGGGTPGVPFGGVNNSGIGKSYGLPGFLEFTNERPVMERRFLDFSLFYPPYTERVTKLVRKVHQWL